MDPQISEWGNPADSVSHPKPNKIGLEERTRGSEPSQYPEEKKTIVIPSVAASESGRA